MENEGEILHQRKERIAHSSELRRNFDNYIMPGADSETHTTIYNSSKRNAVRTGHKRDFRKLFNRWFGVGGY